ncbi:MAG: four helix bundle protein [Parcubacteria group bacterium]
MPFQPLDKLWIWTEAQDLAQVIYRLLKDTECAYFTKNQIDRSSQSVCDNIAEMFGAYYYEVKKQSLRVSRKECYETINHIEKFKRRELWPKDMADKLSERYGKLIIGINCYIGYLDKRKKSLPSQST